MAGFRFSRNDDAQVDPFNAGEPALPWDDPSSLADDGEVFDEKDDEVEYAAHGEGPGAGVPHKPDDNYQAPTTRGHDYDAPSIDEPKRPTKKRPRRPRQNHAPVPSAPKAPGARSQSKLGNALAVIVTLIIAFSVIGSVVPLVSSCIMGVFADDASDGTYSSSTQISLSYDGDEWVNENDRAAAAATERLEDLLTGSSSAELRERIATHIDDMFVQAEGMSSDELGIDVDEWAAQVISGTELGEVEAYAYPEDGEAHAYLDVTAPSVNNAFWEADEEVFEYLYQNELLGTTSALDEKDRERISELFRGATEDIEPAELFLSLNLELVDGEWVVDEESLDLFVQDAYGLY